MRALNAVPQAIAQGMLVLDEKGCLPEEASSLLDMANDFLRTELLGAEHIISAFAGLSVLPRGEVTPLHASRDHLLSVGPGGMISVVGGKLTTHRRIAPEALGHLHAEVRPGRPSLSDAPLLRAALARGADLHFRLHGPIVDHLLQLCGADATMRSAKNGP